MNNSLDESYELQTNPNRSKLDTVVSIDHLSPNRTILNHVKLRSKYRERRLVRRADETKPIYKKFDAFYTFLRKKEVLFLVLLLDLLVDFTLVVISVIEIERAQLMDVRISPFLIYRPLWQYWINVILSVYNICSSFERMTLSAHPNSVLFSWSTLIDLATAYPFIISLFFYSNDGINWHIPVFLRIWPLVERIRVFLYLQLDSAYQNSRYASFFYPTQTSNSLSSKINSYLMAAFTFDQLTIMLIMLFLRLAAFLYTSLSLFQYAELTFSKISYGLFDSLYFIIITFATVGYGDIAPTNIASRMIIALSILIGVAYFPQAIQRIVETLKIKKQGQSNFVPGGRLKSFVIMVMATDKEQFIAETLSSALTALTSKQKLVFRRKAKNGAANVLDLSSHDHLTESNSPLNTYAKMEVKYIDENVSEIHNETFQIVILSTKPPSNAIKNLLTTRTYSSRVTYIQGTSLSDADLARCSLGKASACFVISDRQKSGSVMKSLHEDNQMVLKIWSIKKFASRVPVYAMSLRPETDVHIRPVCREVVCVHLIKNVILGYASLYKGFCALITNLIHNPPTSTSLKSLVKKAKRSNTNGANSWLDVYSDSVLNRILMAPFNPLFAGKTFSDLAWYFYAEFQLILIGLRLRVPVEINLKKLGIKSSVLEGAQKAYTYKNHLVLNPGDFVLPCQQVCDVKEFVFIAHSIEDLIDIEKLTPQQFEESWDKWFKPRSSDDLGSRSIKTIFESDKSALSDYEHWKTGNRRKTYGDYVSASLNHGNSGNEAVYIGTPKPPHHMVIDNDLQTPFCHLLRDPIKKDYARVFDVSGTVNDITLDKRGIDIYVSESEEEAHKRNSNITFSDKITNLEGHIILCTTSFDIWAYLCTVRSSFLEKNKLTTVLILSPTLPTEEEWKPLSVFPKVYFMLGSPLKRNDLLKAGLQKATAVIIMKQHSKDESVDSEENILDSQAIMATHQIDFMVHDKYVVTELVSKQNIKFIRAKHEMLDHLPRLTELIPSSYKPIDLTHTYRKYSHRADFDLRVRKRPSIAAINTAEEERTDAKSESEGSDFDASDEDFWIAGNSNQISNDKTRSEWFYAQSGIYASGRVLAGDMFDSLIFEEFRNPGLVNVLKLLCGRHFKQWSDINTHLGIMPSVLRQIKLPKKFINKSFSSLFSHLSRNNSVIPIAIYRERANASASSSQFSNNINLKNSSGIKSPTARSNVDHTSPERNSSIPLKRTDSELSLSSTHLHSLDPDRSNGYNNNKTETKNGSLANALHFLTAGHSDKNQLSENLDKLFSDASKLDNDLPVVITNPLPDFILEKKDAVFVLTL